MSHWQVEDARQIYNVQRWSDGYFDFNENAQLVAFPHHTTQISFLDLIDKIHEQGLCLPVLVRFTDILHDRVRSLCQAFSQATNEFGYQGKYQAVYPIKVNQQRHVVEQLIATEDFPIGLEAGSKPELMAVLGLAPQHGTPIICNGYKDSEYIRLALIGRKLGHQVTIVVEKLSELDCILEQAQELGVVPSIGLRVRLASIGKGNWQNTGGEKSKFGLSASQVLSVVDKLKSIDRLEWLTLLHFHLGSQIANIRDIQMGLTECARYYVQLSRLGCQLQTVDVGGGLGVDYEGSSSRNPCSMNYSMQEYANNVVHVFGDVCNQAKLPHPNIITESGRALTAHHAVLLTNVIGVENAPGQAEPKAPCTQSHSLLHELYLIYQRVDERPSLESYHDAVYYLSEAQALYTHGVLSLLEWADAEKIYAAICQKVRGRLQIAKKQQRELLDELNEKLAEKFFCNFSLFQSLPDAWGIDQIFPIIPLQGLEQEPSIRAILQDITCDSDGRIEWYVDGEGVESTLPLPPYDPEAPYYLGIFMVGAYQEILGDMHNLFGDSDSVHVELTDKGYELVEPHEGDTVDDVLRYVHINGEDMLSSYKQQISDADLSEQEKETFLHELIQGLEGYTYLED